MREAINAVVCNGVSVRRAFELYGVPKSTLKGVFYLVLKAAPLHCCP